MTICIMQYYFLLVVVICFSNYSSSDILMKPLLVNVSNSLKVKVMVQCLTASSLQTVSRLRAPIVMAIFVSLVMVQVLPT